MRVGIGIFVWTRDRDGVGNANGVWVGVGIDLLTALHGIPGLLERRYNNLPMMGTQKFNYSTGRETDYYEFIAVHETRHIQIALAVRRR